MDEIICPECGRPNLVEAEKCWYCQIPLVDEEDKHNVPEAASESNEDLSGVEIAKNKSAITEESEENLPDWLKRIRELKKADTPVEEVDHWQQERLFPGLKPEVNKTETNPAPASRPAKSYNAPSFKPVIPEGQPALEEAPSEDFPDKELDKDEKEPDDSENELPEGFTPLEH